MTGEALIAALGLEPHPEGGWYRETWRAPSIDGERAGSTAILFLLKAGERSHWHRVDADEIWLWHQGDALDLLLAESDRSQAVSHMLGAAGNANRAPQIVVPAGHWQAAETHRDGAYGYVLVSCVVAPGFDFGGFELAPPGWAPAP